VAFCEPDSKNTIPVSHRDSGSFPDFGLIERRSSSGIESQNELSAGIADPVSDCLADGGQ